MIPCKQNSANYFEINLIFLTAFEKIVFLGKI